MPKDFGTIQGFAIDCRSAGVHSVALIREDEFLWGAKALLFGLPLICSGSE